jgi:hypothetical protein
VRQNVVGEVGGDLGHAPDVAGRADASALAGERDQPFKKFSALNEDEVGRIESV